MKYQSLLNENSRLKAEIKRLKTQFVISKPQNDVPGKSNTGSPSYQYKSNKDLNLNNSSENRDKINLFISLFRGRDDVFAKRWQNKRGKSGYSPACLNEWEPGVCYKPQVRCPECSQKLYAEFNEKVVEDHLRGNIVVGIYPMCIDEMCYFLAIDFDNSGWQKDVSVLRNVCDEFKIPYAIERSMSGNGAHVWFFFENQISAALARKFGTALLTCSMSKRHEIKFKSYDRLFPNQDTMPKGGLGNLIALPLQMAARKNGNTVFIDENFEPYADQWTFLGKISKLSEDYLGVLITRLCRGNELGDLRKDGDETLRPWATTRIRLGKQDLPKTVGVVKSDMVYIPKKGFSQKALNTLKRLAAFNNPDFCKAQAMRIPIYNRPRIISCSEESERYLCLPRGCEEEINNLLSNCKVDVTWIDETNCGRIIDVEFNGSLRKEQQEVFEELMHHDTGVLSATTAFGPRKNRCGSEPDCREKEKYSYIGT